MRNFIKDISPLIFIAYTIGLAYLFLTFAKDNVLIIYSLAPTIFYLTIIIYGNVRNFFRSIRKR